METKVEENDSLNTNIDILGYLLDSIDKSQLYIFLDENNFKKSGSKEKMLYDFKVDYENITDIDKKKRIYDKYKSFLLTQIKYTNNRIIITVPIQVAPGSTFKYKSKLFQYTTMEEDEFDFDNVLNWDSDTTDFDMIYQHLNAVNDNVQSIERAYGRKVQNKNINNGIEEIKEKYEYVWIELNVIEKCVRIIISNNTKNYLDELQGTTNEMYKYFFNEIRKDFNVVLSNEAQDDKNTLFNIYQELTSALEAPYTKKVMPLKDEIDNTTKKWKDRLEIDDVYDIEIGKRIFKLLERSLIQKDFELFIRKNNNIVGKVKSIVFRDRIGGSVQANAGGKYGEDHEIFLEDSDVYFDTRESIYAMKELYSILVEWYVDEDLGLDDRYETVKVKYTVHPEYYVTRFIRYNLRKEVYNYVLPKFEKYRE